MRPRDLQGAIRRRIFLVALVAIVTTTVAVGIGIRRPPTYRAQARIIITDTDTSAALLDVSQTGQSAQQVGLMTQTELIGSAQFVEQVIRTLGLTTTPIELMTRVSISLVGQTSIVAIDVTDTEAARAVQVANSFAQTYVDWSRDRERASTKAAGDKVEAQLAATQQQISALEAKGSITSGIGRAKFQAAQDSYAALSVRLQGLRLAEQVATGAGSVMPATVSDAVPVTPGPLRDGAAGLAIGLLAGLGLSVVAELADDSIRSGKEATDAYGAPVLAHIPSEKPGRPAESRLSVVNRPRGPAAEAYRVLRNGLEYVRSQRHLKTLLVTSAGPGEGASAIAANLSVLLARANCRVLLLACDFHRPIDDQYFDVDGAIGLSGVLDETTAARSVLQSPTGFDNLYVLAAGLEPPNPSELVTSAAMGALITALSEEFDWVIVDAPPLLSAADAAAIARWTDGALLVSRMGVSKRGAAGEARAQLDNAGAHILGVAVWGL